MKLWLRKVGGALYPDRDESVEAFADIPSGKPLFCEIKQPRSQKFDGLFWALCHRIGKGIGKDAKWVEESLMIETGRFTEYKDLRGHTYIKPDSIAHHKMDGLEFRKFWEECLVVIYDKWGLDPKTFADLFRETADEHR